MVWYKKKNKSKKLSSHKKNEYTNLQEQIIDLLKEKEMGIDELLVVLNLDIAKLNSILFELELAGYIIQYPGPIFALK